jgi:hypothetical protein
MPCNCSKKNLSRGFVYQSPSGTTQKFATEVEAKAAKIRAGNVGVVKPA